MFLVLVLLVLFWSSFYSISASVADLFLFWFLCCSYSGFSPVTILVPLLFYPVLPLTWFLYCSCSDSHPDPVLVLFLVLILYLICPVLVMFLFWFSSCSGSCADSPVVVVPFLFWFLFWFSCCCWITGTFLFWFLFCEPQGSSVVWGSLCWSFLFGVNC